MRVLFEILLAIIIAMFAYKAFGWIFPKKEKKGRKSDIIEGEIIK